MRNPVNTLDVSAPSVQRSSGCHVWWCADGVPSDPQKQARVRVINRAFGAAITKLGGARHLHSDPALQNATRFALKVKSDASSAQQIDQA